MPAADPPPGQPADDSSRGRPGWPWLTIATGFGAAAIVALGLVAVVHRRPDPTAAVDLDIPYGSAGGSAVRLDIFRPAGPPRPRPGVLLIHGGGWVGGDRSSEHPRAEALARAGYVAIAVGYRLAVDDATRYPAQVDDVRQAVRYIRQHADRVGVDPDRLAAFGHSAGGHLAAVLGTTPTEPGGTTPLVRCVVDLAGPADFTDPTCPPLCPKAEWAIPRFFGPEQVGDDRIRREVSPARQVAAWSAPMLIVHGTADDIVPVEQSRRLDEALRAAGVASELIELPGEGHGYSDAAFDRLMARILAFLGDHLGP